MTHAAADRMRDLEDMATPSGSGRFFQ